MREANPRHRTGMEKKVVRCGGEWNEVQKAFPLRSLLLGLKQPQCGLKFGGKHVFSIHRAITGLFPVKIRVITRL